MGGSEAGDQGWGQVVKALGVLLRSELSLLRFLRRERYDSNPVILW